MDRVLLAETPASANGLIIGFPAIRKPDKDHLVAVLPVHAITGDLWLANQHLYIATSKAHKSLGFVVGLIGPLHFYSISNSGCQLLAFVVQVAPNKNLTFHF